jgi:uncharacterized membrane protein
MSNLKKSANKKNRPDRQTDSFGIIAATAFAGPLPAPDVLQGFETVVPGAAERIIVMAEKEQSARLQREGRLTNMSIVMVVLGIFSALVSLGVISYLIKYSIDKGYPNVASILASTSLIGVIGLFIWFRRKKESK